MAFPFLYSWWHYSDQGQMASAHHKEIPCEEEEEEDEEICWFMGEMLLFYCLAILILKLGSLAAKRFFQKQPCGTLSCNWKVHSKGGQGCSCQCHCKITLCGLFRKIFGGKGNEETGDPPVSPPMKKRLKKRLSLLSQQTFCDSDSSGTGSPDSQLSSWKWSQTGDSVSMASRMKKKQQPRTAAKTPRNPETAWLRQQPCLRCKAKRTREWLIRHFYNQDSPLQNK
ncbi:serine-rich single-pass membrane protein 1 [Pantherophis guttatus]|uniref:Serine-rich single-pass membrane protein 1 n=1 Tax=Pantherophis guttatus TaxID=94885 RepID=A0ABM3Z8M9_PANGU|nr:serine-rich single-pass membrane protein 1 [Pantherophis guttatus]